MWWINSKPERLLPGLGLLELDSLSAPETVLVAVPRKHRCLPPRHIHDHTFGVSGLIQARLQYEIIEDVPPGSECTGWPWPSESAYNDMVDFFEATAQNLEEALKEGSELENF